MVDEPVHGCNALANRVQELIGDIDAGHHVLEDECLVLQFRPLAGGEGSSRAADRIVYRLAHGVHAFPSHR